MMNHTGNPSADIESREQELSVRKFGKLTAGIVHDLRSGLGVIRNTLGFLVDGLDDPVYQGDLVKITRSLDFCELVLRNLATLGGQETSRPQHIDLETVVREVHSIVERKLVDVCLILEMAPDATDVWADEGQIRQVFMNLIQNAGEAMPDGGTLTVRAQREGEMLRIQVSDTGCGISPENQELLFREYFTTKERGYGLGLHIVHTIVERHGGTIEVESELGKGTTFTLRLPIKVGDEDG